MWVMGVREWHAGYSTCSTKKYRHVVGNRTKDPFLGKMPTAERITFAMWRCNDYLPGLKGVGWKTARAQHEAYKKISGEDEKVMHGCSCVRTPGGGLVYVVVRCEVVRCEVVHREVVRCAVVRSTNILL